MQPSLPETSFLCRAFVFVSRTQVAEGPLMFSSCLPPPKGPVLISLLRKPSLSFLGVTAATQQVPVRLGSQTAAGL